MRRRTIRDRIVDYLAQHPEGADDDELTAALGLRYRQQANSLCRKLASEGVVERRRVAGKLRNFLRGPAETAGRPPCEPSLAQARGVGDERGQARAGSGKRPPDEQAVIAQVLESDRATRHRRRLRRDFLGPSWDILDSRTQQCLVSAELAWESAAASGGREASILNELRLAFEYELRAIFTDPLRDEIQSILSNRSLARELGLTSWDAGGLNARELAALLKESGRGHRALQAVKRVIERAHSRDKRFICEELPGFLRRLWRARSRAEHGGEIADVGALRREALGLGREGFLPRLARIKRTLS